VSSVVRPLIGSALSSVAPNTVRLFARNAVVFGPVTSFAWTVDDEGIGETTTELLVHDFSAAMPSAEADALFSVGVMVVGGPRSGSSGKETLCCSIPMASSNIVEKAVSPQLRAPRERAQEDYNGDSLNQNPEEQDELLSIERVGFQSCGLDKATMYQERPAVQLVVPVRGNVDF
jgi:hypothetical protein